ncbi:uncharacterized, partial [Tachysurus ichikawai]
MLQSAAQRTDIGETQRRFRLLHRSAPSGDERR